MKEKHYLAIDLKSFYASVECAARGLDPLTTNLVVADISRTEKTICLAVSPSLKAYGISGRARLFEVVQRVKEINAVRQQRAPGRKLTSESSDDLLVKADPTVALDYIAAPPRMSRYMEVSAQIYNIYLRYIAPEDIHVYSVDEVFIDATNYLNTYHMTPRELAMKLILEVLKETGITATAGIAPNLFLCKVAMDIEAKHIAPDANGVRIAELTERSFREKYWTHRPLTDFWRFGGGTARKLEKHRLFTLGDIARCSLGGERDYYNEELLYKLFGINAELIIDHAWGWEPCTIADIKAYRPDNNSFSSGQVLSEAYSAEKARIVLREMTDAMVLNLVEKGLVTDQITLTVVYDVDNLLDPERRKQYRGPVTEDRYGRKMPKQAHGSENLGGFTSSGRKTLQAALELYDRIVDRTLLVRRIYLGVNHVISESDPSLAEPEYEQLDLFASEEAEKRKEQEIELAREKRRQQAVLSIQKKFGKNAILKGTSLEEGATAKERNSLIGGHKA